MVKPPARRAARSTGRPDPTGGRIAPQVMTALLGALRGGLGDFTLLDATLPRGESAGLERNALFVCCGPSAAPERQFLSRFRQGGGHRELPLLAADGTGSAGAAGLLESLDRTRPMVVLADSPAQARALAGLAEPTASLVVRANAAHPAADRAALAAWLPGRRVVAVRVARGGPSFRWLLPQAFFDSTRAALALEPGIGPTRREPAADAVLSLTTPADAPWHAGTGAATLIHDGGYRSESDGDYSWLWTGPSNHFRILLAGVPPLAAKLGISVIKTESPRNLAALRVLVDGRHVPHRFQPWSELSGKVTVDLAPAGNGPTVLSLVCPHMVPDADGRRLLGLCIDRIDLVS